MASESLLEYLERAPNTAQQTRRTAIMLVGMALGLAICYRASDQLPLTALGLAIFAALALLRPDLGLLFVPLTVPLYLMPKGIWDERFGIRPEGIRFPLHEIVLLVVLAATLMRLGLRLPRWQEELRRLSPNSQQGSMQRWHMFVELIPVLLFLGAATLGVLLALPEGRGEALRQWRWLIVEPVFFYGLVRYWSASGTPSVERRAQSITGYHVQLLSALALAGGGVAAVGLLQYAGFDPTPWIGQRMSHVDSVVVIDGVRRVTSVYGHPNNLGLFLGRVWPVALALGVGLWLDSRAAQQLASAGYRVPASDGSRDNKRPGSLELPAVAYRLSFVFCLLSLVALLGLTVTYSRGANMGALAAGAVLGWGLLRLARGASSRWTIGLGFGLLAALLLTMFRDDPASGSVNTRLLLWSEALAILRDHPLGAGLGQFYFYHNPEYGHGYIAPALVGTSEQYAAHPHNLLFDTLLQLGPIGFVGLTWLLLRFVRRAFAAQRTAPPLEATLLLGLLAGMTAALVHGAVDNFYFVPDLAIFFWLAMAIARPRSR